MTTKPPSHMVRPCFSLDSRNEVSCFLIGQPQRRVTFRLSTCLLTEFLAVRAYVQVDWEVISISLSFLIDLNVLLLALSLFCNRLVMTVGLRLVKTIPPQEAKVSCLLVRMFYEACNKSKIRPLEATSSDLNEKNRSEHLWLSLQKLSLLILVQAELSGVQ